MSVIALLGLGIFASTAAIVRLTVTVNLSATTDFLYAAMPVAAWAYAELGLGVILANLPALRPLLEKILSLRSTLRSSNKRTNDRTTHDRYIELEEGKKRNANATNNSKGIETRVYGGDLGDDNSSLGDDQSTKNIVNQQQDPSTIGVQRQFHVTHEDI